MDLIKTLSQFKAKLKVLDIEPADRNSVSVVRIVTPDDQKFTYVVDTGDDDTVLRLARSIQFRIAAFNNDKDVA